jgi:hypothetical protein
VVWHIHQAPSHLIAQISFVTPSAVWVAYGIYNGLMLS